MSDEERDSIDLEVSKCVTAATESITALSNSLGTRRLTGDDQLASDSASPCFLVNVSHDRTGTRGGTQTKCDCTTQGIPESSGTYLCGTGMFQFILNITIVIFSKSVIAGLYVATESGAC